MRKKTKGPDKSASRTNRARRSTTNAVSLVVTVVALAVATRMADGTFVSRISKISENVDRALDSVINEGRPTYEIAEINATYKSDATFNPSGMAGLYNITKLFMEFVVPLDILPPDLIDVSPSGDIKFETDVSNLLKHFAGIMTILVILLLFLLLMPLCGFCFCCCRCCGNCGAKVLPYDKKRDLCKKLVLATFLICFATLLIFGVVCAFVSNEQLKDGLNELPHNLENAVDDSDTYLNVTRQEIDNILLNNFAKFNTAILNIFDEGGEIFYNELLILTKSISFKNISDIARSMEDVKSELTMLNDNTKNLRIYASQLNDAIRKLKYDLLMALKNCTSNPVCQEFSSKYVNNLSTDIDFDKLPNISNELSKLQQITDGNMLESIDEGNAKLDEIQDKIDHAINQTLHNVKEKVAEGGMEVEHIREQVGALFANISTKLNENARPSLKDVDTYVGRYHVYLYYVGLVLGCILLLVTVFITLGLICGVCGKRPAKHNEDCCNKGAGSTYLMCAVYFMFLFAAAFAVVAIVYFVLGTLSQRVICDTLRDPRDSSIVDTVGKLVDLRQFNISANVTSVIEACHRNRSIYEVFQLEKTFDLTKLKNFAETYNINGILHELNATIKFDDDNVQFLSADAESQLNELMNSGISDISYDKFVNELSSTSFTTVNMDELQENLQYVIGNLSKLNLDNTVSQLKIISYHLDTYQLNILDPIRSYSKNVTSIASSLDEKMKFGYDSFNVAIKTLIDELKTAEKTIKDNGTLILTEITTQFANDVLDIIGGYVNFSITNVESDIGKCGPLSLVINGTLTSTCDKIITPINGFWFCVLLSLLVFLPTIVVSVKLASLYKKSDFNHHGLIIERTPGKADKKRNKRKNKRYDSRGAYSQELNDHSRDYPGASSFPDNRYQDMAPKHWEEFPNGGPPQYQRAPTEYDRPPPYYYPANAEQH